jgi:lipopolysaccharide transport system ATP-binding protein
MGEVRVEFDGVWKRFRKGVRAGSLRDATPAFAARFARWLRTPRPTDALRPNEFYSLKDVSFQVRSGECLGIIGPNGAGKSTLLKCASRILRPNRGAVRMKGRVSALIEVGAGFHPDLTGRENVYLNGAVLGMRRREIREQFDAIVEFAGLADFIDTPVKRYSSGMYARLGFAVAAFMKPDVLLVDEVLSVGDMNFARKCERKIKQILSGETTVLFISHNLAAVRTVCDRVLVLAGGRVRFDGDPDQAIRVYHDMVGGEENTGQAHPAVEKLKYTILDAYGSPTTGVPPGASATLDVALVARRRIDEAAVGFFVRDSDDAEVYACTMESLGVEPVDLAPGQTLRARFRIASNLVPGAYWIGSIVHGRPAGELADGRVCFDRTPNRQQLTVLGGSEVRGTANLFAECVASIDAPAELSATAQGRN